MCSVLGCNCRAIRDSCGEVGTDFDAASIAIRSVRNRKRQRQVFTVYKLTKIYARSGSRMKSACLGDIVLLMRECPALRSVPGHVLSEDSSQHLNTHTISSGCISLTSQGRFRFLSSPSRTYVFSSNFSSSSLFIFSSIFPCTSKCSSSRSYGERHAPREPPDARYMEGRYLDNEVVLSLVHSEDELLYGGITER